MPLNEMEISRRVGGSLRIIGIFSHNLHGKWFWAQYSIYLVEKHSSKA